MIREPTYLLRNEKEREKGAFSRSAVLFVVDVLEDRFLSLCCRRHRGLDTGRDSAAR